MGCGAWGVAYGMQGLEIGVVLGFMVYMVWGAGVRMGGVGCRVWRLKMYQDVHGEHGIQSLGFWVKVVELRVWGLGFGILG